MNKFVCMNHDPSVIFKSNTEDPKCPKCKKTDCVYGYSGTKGVTE